MMPSSRTSQMMTLSPPFLAAQLDKDFTSAQPLPATANNAIIHTTDVMCGRFQDESWIPYRMGKLLDNQSKLAPLSSSSLFLPSSSFMTEIMKPVDRAPSSLDNIKFDQSSASSLENATLSSPPPHHIGTQSRLTFELAVNKSRDASAPDSSDSEGPIGFILPPEELIGSVCVWESLLISAGPKW